MSKVEFKKRTHWDVRVDGTITGTIHASPRGYFYMPKGQTMSMMVPEYQDTLEECKAYIVGES